MSQPEASMAAHERILAWFDRQLEQTEDSAAAHDALTDARGFYEQAAPNEPERYANFAALNCWLVDHAIRIDDADLAEMALRHTTLVDQCHLLMKVRILQARQPKALTTFSKSMVLDWWWKNIGSLEPEQANSTQEMAETIKLNLARLNAEIAVGMVGSGIANPGSRNLRMKRMMREAYPKFGVGFMAIPGIVEGMSENDIFIFDQAAEGERVIFADICGQAGFWEYASLQDDRRLLVYKANAQAITDAERKHLRQMRSRAIYRPERLEAAAILAIADDSRADESFRRAVEHADWDSVRSSAVLQTLRWAKPELFRLVLWHRNPEIHSPADLDDLLTIDRIDIPRKIHALYESTCADAGGEDAFNPTAFWMALHQSTNADRRVYDPGQDATLQSYLQNARDLQSWLQARPESGPAALYGADEVREHVSELLAPRPWRDAASEVDARLSILEALNQFNLVDHTRLVKFMNILHPLWRSLANRPSQASILTHHTARIEAMMAGSSGTSIYSRLGDLSLRSLTKDSDSVPVSSTYL